MTLMGYVIISIPVLIFLNAQWEKYQRSHPKPLPPKTPEELWKEEAERRRRDEEIRRHNLSVRREINAHRAEWRGKYRAYLKSPKWKRVRGRVLAKAQHTCFYCGGNPVCRSIRLVRIKNVFSAKLQLPERKFVANTGIVSERLGSFDSAVPTFSTANESWELTALGICKTVTDPSLTSFRKLNELEGNSSDDNRSVILLQIYS